jgi:YVTN family beta-propeller protein
VDKKAMVGLLAVLLFFGGCRHSREPRLLAVWHTGQGPSALSLSPGGTLLAAACALSDEVWLYDLDRGRVLKRLKTRGLPSALGFSQDGKSLLVSETGGGTMSRFDLQDFRLNKQSEARSPGAFDFSPEGDRILMASQSGQTLDVLRAADFFELKEVALGGTGRGIALASKDRKTYVTTEHSDTLSALNWTNLTVMATLEVGKRPSEVVLSPDGQFAYVACRGKEGDPSHDAGSVAVVKLADWMAVDRISVGTGADGIACSPSGNFIFVACEAAGRLDVLSAKKHERVATLALDPGPSSLQLSRDGNTVFLAQRDSGTLALVDVSDFP